MRKITTLSSIRRLTNTWRASGQRLALVPTMGALHDGHLSLVELAKKHGDRIVVSIFVNPTQFAEGEDLARYPRDEAGDLKKLRQLGVDGVWMPSVKTMYGNGFATTIVPAGAALDLEGAFRPEHFAGVATVCCKLFHQISPDVAIFGDKDFQQLAVIRQMVRDLDLNLKIVAAKTLRDKNGLALSSRNRYLNDDHHTIAPTLFKVLKAAAKRAKAGGRVSSIEAKANRDLLAAGFSKIDYVAIRDATTLGPYRARRKAPGRVLAAAWLGKTRLIDNCAI